MPERTLPTQHVRTWTLEHVRATNDELREVEAIGVPYGQVITPDPEGIHVGETFDEGSVTLRDEGTLAFYRHGEPIGLTHTLNQTPTGPKIVMRLSNTTLGRDSYQLAKDGVLRQVSIGWDDGDYVVDDAGVRHWTAVPAREFSLVPFGAYGEGATVTKVRSKAKETDMPPETDTLTREDLKPVNAALDELKRGLALVGKPAEPAAPKFRSMAHFLKAIAAGDEAAAEFHRAYTGATTDDTIMKDSFIGEFIKLVTQRRRIVEKFSRDTLPKDGLSVDFYQLDTDTTQVGKQAAQGDDLPYGQIKLKKDNAPIETYGGWTELSRQAIERASYSALNITLRALALKYGQTTEAAARAVYLAQIATNRGAAGQFIDMGATAAAATADQWLDAIVDAAEKYETNGFGIAGLDVSKDVFKTLIHLKDGDHRLMKVYGDGVNQVGVLDLSKLSGNLAGIKVEMIPLATAGTASFYDPVAITTLESPGAPAQLQDENIINLSKQFSLYGYAANVVPFPTAIVPVKFAAA